MTQISGTDQAPRAQAHGLAWHIWGTVLMAFGLGIAVSVLLYSIRDGATGMALAISWIFLGGITVGFLGAARSLYKALHRQDHSKA